MIARQSRRRVFRQAPKASTDNHRPLPDRKAWLSWRGLKWGRMNRHSRVRELRAMTDYYATNPPVKF